MNSPRGTETLGSVSSVVRADQRESAVPRVPGSLPADTAASHAAAAAGVEVRLLADAGFEEVDGLFGSIWGAAKPMSSELMRALAHSGSYVAGAYDGDRIAGGCVGFFGAPESRTMHSHIAGVAAPARGRNVGYALKMHQHAWALSQQVRSITWTFDPLVRRNAYFNIAKLGAVATAYLPNFYGAMTDGINAGQDSDRLMMTWAVAPTITPGRADADPGGGRVVLDEDDAGRPVQKAGRSGSRLLVRVPRDIEDLRRSDPGLARSWRGAVRDLLGALLLDGARVTGFSRSGFYVVEEAAS
jgi:predicted GNAT superfamily acetyltransferase